MQWKVIAASLALILSSCDWDVQIKQLEAEHQTMSHNQEVLQAQINDLRSEHEKSLIEQSCKNPRVLKFLQDCKKFLESGEGHECNKLNVEQALKFMSEEQHVVVRLRPQEGLSSMTENRKNQLSHLLDTSKLKSISSVLVIAQPPDNKPENGNQALEFGRKIRGYQHESLHVPDTAMFRPLLISCRGKSQMLDLYASQVVDDKPDFEEPQGKAPKVALWVFRLDCGNVATSDMDSVERQPTNGPRTASAAH
jgi:hypothetical protein